ncbi:hypothetical protein [Streptomyces violaceorubidus]|uniref:Uncharacterized protein n=1 Tax=Streptomyces violaceorubidus TaxID=284042 RepID=A0ABV1T0R7_9ACTN
MRPNLRRPTSAGCRYAPVRLPYAAARQSWISSLCSTVQLWRCPKDSRGDSPSAVSEYSTPTGERGAPRP